jgi:DUF4097 and DUF4098 domain-containing protein YvlB
MKNGPTKSNLGKSNHGNSRRVRSAVFLLFGSAILYFSAAEANTQIDESRPIAADGLVEIDNLAGSIEITTWDKPEVHISGELGARVEKLEIQESSAGVKIRVRNNKGQRNVDETNLRLQVPSTVSVQAESVSANLDIRGLNGNSLSFDTVSGDVFMEAKVQRLDIESVSGDVSFDGAAPRASVETVSGEINLHGIEGEITISTVSGDVSMTGSHIGRGRFETVSGDLHLTLDVADRGRLNAQSMSGDVRLQLPSGQQAEYSAQSYSGDIDSDFGKVTGNSPGPGHSLSFQQGDNGATIEIESFSGDINITTP